MTSIEQSAFEDCSSLTSIEIPDNVRNIGNKALAGCTSLTSITIGNNVTSLGTDVFKGCSSITDLKISYKDIGVLLSDSKKTLQNLTLGESVESIGDNAFDGFTALKKVSLGSGVTSVGTKAFANCPKLEDVYCYAVRYPAVNADAFENSYIDYVTLHVPARSLTQYKNHSVWGKFMDVVPISEDDVTSIATIEEENVKIKSNNGQIWIDGAAGKVVRLYTLGGALITTVNPQSSMTGKFAVSAGTYIVKVGNKTTKIVVK